MSDQKIKNKNHYALLIPSPPAIVDRKTNTNT